MLQYLRKWIPDRREIVKCQVMINKYHCCKTNSIKI